MRFQNKVRLLFQTNVVCVVILVMLLKMTLHFGRGRPNNRQSKNRTTTLVNRKEDDIVSRYLEQERRHCVEQTRIYETHRINISTTKRNSWCPCLPPDLKGRLAVDITNDPQEWPGIISKVGHGTLAGGEWRPPNCLSTNHMAIIIPCRDRDRHLQIMLRHLYPILQRQLSHFRIFVVEQNYPAVFNKAAMMNVGFLEASKRFPEMNCVMFHDVDHLLEDDRTLLNCGPQPHHYATAMDEWNYRLIYSGAFGGAVAMRPDVFLKVNGYSLQYFGWGGEDDDMGSRVRQLFGVFRPPLEISRYTTIKHDSDGSNPKNNGRHDMMRRQHERYKNKSFDGLSDLMYDLNDVQLRPLYTWFHVNLNVTGINTYPDHQVYRYIKRQGVCRVPDAGDNLDVSFSTCRYMCDVQPRHPCVAFAYHRTNYRVNNRQTIAKCVLLRTLCDNIDLSSGATFIKWPPSLQ